MELEGLELYEQLPTHVLMAPHPEKSIGYYTVRKVPAGRLVFDWKFSVREPLRPVLTCASLVTVNRPNLEGWGTDIEIGLVVCYMGEFVEV